MIYIYLHLSHKSSAKYTSSMDPMGYRNPGIPISTASSTMEALLSACCARLFLSKKTGFPRYGVWKPRAA